MALQTFGGFDKLLACVLHELKELFEDEAAAITFIIKTKIIMKKAYYVGAASIADKLNSSFSRGAHDGQTDLYTASIATSMKVRVLTSSSQLQEYDGMGCEVSDLETWVEELGNKKPK